MPTEPTRVTNRLLPGRRMRTVPSAISATTVRLATGVGVGVGVTDGVGSGRHDRRRGRRGGGCGFGWRRLVLVRPGVAASELRPRNAALVERPPAAAAMSTAGLVAGIARAGGCEVSSAERVRVVLWLPASPQSVPVSRLPPWSVAAGVIAQFAGPGSALGRY